MRWSGRRQSDNIEDRRGMGGKGIAAGGGLIGVVVVLVAMFMGVDPESLPLEQPSAPGAERRADPSEEKSRQFTATVLADTEDVWNELFPKHVRKDYPEPRLVLFSGSTQSNCGFASAATGPFYCPADQKLYIDLQFFEELATRYRAAGDFAQAYVIAHEVGHHVQNQLGVLNDLHSRRGRVSEAEFNRQSVRVELQADYLAGVWAHHAQRTKDILEPGDIDEALGAASAVGDDRLQKQSRGHVAPDSFTHGTSEQRARWFRLGFETGDVSRMMEILKIDYNRL